MSAPPDNVFYLEVCGALQTYLLAQAALTALVGTRIFRQQQFAAAGETPAPLAKPHLTFRQAAPPEFIEGRYGLCQRLRFVLTAQGGGQTAEVDVEKVLAQAISSLQADTNITNANIRCHDIGYDGFMTPAVFDEKQRCWWKEARIYIVASQI